MTEGARQRRRPMRVHQGGSEVSLYRVLELLGQDCSERHEAVDVAVLHEASLSGNGECAPRHHPVCDHTVDEFAALGDRRWAVLVVGALPLGCGASSAGTYPASRNHQLILACVDKEDGVAGVWPGAAIRRMPGATSASSSTSFQFFHFGKISPMRLPAGLAAPPATFRAGPAPSTNCIQCADDEFCIGNTTFRALFIRPQTWSGWKCETRIVLILAVIDSGCLHVGGQIGGVGQWQGRTPRICRPT